MLCDSNGKAVWDKENLLFPEVFTCKAEVGGFVKDVFLH